MTKQLHMTNGITDDIKQIRMGVLSYDNKKEEHNSASPTRMLFRYGSIPMTNTNEYLNTPISRLCAQDVEKDIGSRPTVIATTSNQAVLGDQGPICIPWSVIPAIVFFLWKFAKPLLPKDQLVVGGGSVAWD